MQSRRRADAAPGPTAQEPQAPQEEAEQPEERSLRVLLVDDRPDNLLALQAVLEPLGVGMVTAPSGEEALRLLLNEEFALIVLDVQMPGLDGFETARLIKGRERTRHLPIIFLTAISGAVEHHLEGYASGAVDYVYKPFEPAILRAKVAALVDLVETKRRLEVEVARRAASEHQLEERERQLAEAGSLAHVGAWGWDIATGVVVWSDELFRIFGLEPRSIPVTYDDYRALLHPDDGSLVDEAVERALRTGEPYQVEHRVVRPDGTVVWVRGQGRVVSDENGPVRMFGAAQDITERRRSEEQFTQFFDLSLDLMAVADIDGFLRRVNRSFTRALGWSEAELLARPQLDLVHPDDRDRVAAELGKLREGQETTDFELRMACSDGTYRWFRSSAKPVPDEGVIYVVAIDITERKRAAGLLVESEERYRVLVEHAPEAIVVLDLDTGHFVEVNPEAERLFGMGREELCRTGPADVSPEFQPDGRSSLDGLTQWSERMLAGDTTQFEWLHKDAAGQAVLCEVRLLPLPSSGRRLVRGSLIDVTERRRGEAAAREIAERERGLRQQQQIAQELQRGLLPERLPDIPDLEFAARYLPGSAGLDVGGDWYDVFPLRAGNTAFAIGDIVGRGLRAAVTMGQLRTALRAYVLDDASPARVVARLDRLTDSLPEASMATLMYGVYQADAGVLRYVCAGHPPPLVVDPVGRTTFLEDGRWAPVGVGVVHSHEGGVVLEPGSTLVLYTDGLVERPGESLDDGMRRLAEAAAVACAGDPEQVCDSIVEAMLGTCEPIDDVALLVVRLAQRASEQFRFTGLIDPRHLGSVRHALRRWLTDRGATDAEADDMVLAASEAASNALMHAYGPEEGAVEIEACADGDDVSVYVRDVGAWRSRAPTDGGRGLLLIEALVGSAEVAAGDAGTEVRMHRRLGVPLLEKKAMSLPSFLEQVAGVDEPEEAVAVAQLTEDIDLANAQRVGDTLASSVGKRQLGLVVDLSALRYLDSSGIRVFFELRRSLESRRQKLWIVVPSDSPVRRLLELAPADSIVPTALTVEEATDAIKRHFA